MKNSRGVHAYKATSPGRLARTFLLVIALIPAMRDARAGSTITLGADDSSFTDSNNYTDPTVSDLIKDGTGFISLTGTNTYTSGTTINSGTLQIGVGGTAGSIVGDVVDSSILSFDRSDAYVFGGNISGVGEVQQNGNGALTLGGNNTYSGGTTVNSGTLNAGSNTAFGTGFLKVTAGTVDLGGHNLSVGSLDAGNAAAGVITNTTGASTLTTSNGTDATFGGTIVDGGGTVVLAKSGSATLTLTGANTYTGGTTINAGTLLIGNGGTTGSIAGDVSLTDAGAILNFERSNAVTFGGAITGSGQVVQSGVGTLTLSGTNSYSGNTTFSGGGLNINSSTALGSGSSTFIVFGGGTHTIDNTSGGAITLVNNNAQIWTANFTFTGSNNLNLGTGAVSMSNNPTVTVAAGQLTVGGGIISGDSSSLTKAGSGELILTGDNTYAGGTTISGGTLRIGAGTATGSVVGAITDNATLAFERSNSAPVSNIISGSGNVIQDGSGNLTLSGANSYSGGTTLNNGTITLGNDTALGIGGALAILNTATVDLNGHSSTIAALSGASGATLTNNAGTASTLTISSNLAGLTYAGAVQDGSTSTVALVKSGTGSLTLSGTNTFTGGTTLNSGTLALNGASALGHGSFTIASSSSLDNTSGSAVVLTTHNAQNWNANFTFAGSNDLDLGDGAVTLSASRIVTVTKGILTVGGAISGVGLGLTKSGFGELDLTGSNTYSGSTLITGGTLSIGNGGTSGSIGGTSGITVNGSLIFNHSDTITADKPISGFGNVTQNGTGNLILSGNNTYTGGTTVQNGVLTVGSSTALGAVTSDLTIQTATVDLAGQSVTVGALNGFSSILTSVAAASLTTSSGFSANFSGAISGAVTLVKSGAGTLTLSGNNTFTGGATLNAGTLTLNSTTALGNGPLTIAGVSKLDNTVGGLTVSNNNAQFWNSDFTFKGSHTLDLGTGAVTLNATHTVTIQANSLTVGGAISGPAGAGLIKSGAGTLILTGANTYSGGTTVNAGTLDAGSDTAFGTGFLKVTAGTVDLGGHNVSIGSLDTGNAIAGVITNTTGASILTTNSGTAATFGGTIQDGGGTVALVKSGSGALSLTGANIYTGGTTVNGGTLFIGNGGTTGSITGDVSTTNPGVLNFDRSDAVTFGGMISGSGQVVQSGTGTLTLSNSNTYSGGTRLTGGGLNINNSAAIGSGNFTIIGAGTHVIDNTSGSSIALVNDNTQSWNANFTFTGSNNLDLGDGDVAISNNPTVTVANGQLTEGGVISGSSSLRKAGSGDLILTGDNAYTGGTIISGGTLHLGGNAGSVIGSIADNAHLSFEHNADFIADNTISGTGDLDQNSSHTLTLTGNSTYSGGTKVDAGTLALGSNTAFGTGTLTINNTATVDLNGRSTSVTALSGVSGTTLTNNAGTASTLTINSNLVGLPFAGVIKDGSGGGTVALAKSGTGSLTLSGTNTYTGGTTLSGGTLALISASALGTGPLTIAGSSSLDNTSGSPLALTTHNVQNWNANFTFTGSNNLDLGDGGVTLNATHTVTVQANSLTIGGVISGAAGAGLTKDGAGSLILTGANTYSGPTTITAGTLQIGGTAGQPGTGNIVDNGALVFNRSNIISVGNVISGTGSVTKSGAGILILSGVNTYTGGTTVSAGTLQVGNAAALGGATGSVTISPNTVLDLHGFSIAIGTLSGANGTLTSNSAPATLTSNTATSNGDSFAVNIQDGTGGGIVSLVKNGSGTLILSGTNNYTGGTTLNAGTLDLGNNSAIGSGALTITGGKNPILANSSGSTITLANNPQAWNTNFQYNSNSDLNFLTGAVSMNATRTVSVTGTGALIVGGTISGLTTKVGLTVSGGGLLALTGTNTYAGLTTIATGTTFQLGNGGSTGSLPAANKITDNGTLAFDHSQAFTFSNIISGKGGVATQIGSGSLLLTGANTYTGGTYLYDASIVIGNAKALGAATGSLNLLGGGLDLNGFSITVGPMSANGANIIQNSLASTTSTLTTNSNVNTTFASGIEDGSGAIALVKGGTGTLTLSHANNFSGGFTLKAGGLAVANSDALSLGTFTIAGVSTLDNASAGSLVLNGHNENWNANFTFLGTHDLELSVDSVRLSATRTITVANHTLTVDGAVSGQTATTGLTKAGTGTLILAVDNTYGGATTVSAGTLQLGNGFSDGSIGAGKISLGTGATLALDRTGTFTLANAISGAGNLTLMANATLTLSGANSYTGITRINNGTLLVGSAKALGVSQLQIAKGASLDLNGFSTTVASLSSLTNVNVAAARIVNSGAGVSTLTVNGKSTSADPYAGVITGAVALAKSGTGALTLSGASDYSGGTTVTAGTLNINSSTALGTGLLTIAGASTIDNTSGSAVSLSNNNVQLWKANFTFKGTSDLDLGTGAVSMSATRTVTVTTGALTVGGTISGATATTGLTKAGPGTLILTGDNTTTGYTGPTTITAGTLQLGDGGTSGNLRSISKIADTGTLTVNRSDSIPINNIISGVGKVIQNGSGNLTLGGLNTYTGGTIVNDATLTVANAAALGKGSLTLNDGILQTDGNIHRINVTGNVSWNSAATIHLTLTPNPTTSESVNIAGSVIALDSGPFTFDFATSGLPVGTNNFIVMTAAKGFGTLTGANFTFTGDPNLDPNSTFQIIGTSLWFNDGYGESAPPADSVAPSGGMGFAGPQPVPEPETWMLLILGGAVLFMAKGRIAKTSRTLN